jgi:hypothetical protein
MNNGQDVHQNTTRNGYRSAFNRLLAEGDTAVYYLNGSGKLGGPIATDFQAQAGPIAGCHVSNYAFAAFAHYIGVSSSLLETLIDIQPTLKTDWPINISPDRTRWNAFLTTSSRLRMLKQSLRFTIPPLLRMVRKLSSIRVADYT